LLALTNRVVLEHHEAELRKNKFSCTEKKIEDLEREVALKNQEHSEISDIKQIISSLEVENKAQRCAFLDQSKQIEKLHQDLKSSEREINLLADEIIQHRHDLTLVQRERDLLQEQLIRLTTAMEDQEGEILLHNLDPESEKDNVGLSNNTEKTSNNEISSDLRATELLLETTASFRSRLEEAKFPTSDYLRLSAAGALIDNALNNEDRLDLSHAFRKWSANSNEYRTVSRHRQVSAVMNEQLRMTQAKLAALKSHFSKSKDVLT
jgi:hypothetical protein